MARKQTGTGDFPWGPALVVVAIFLMNYKTRNPRCKACGVALSAIKLYEAVKCPVCGTVLDGVQAALS